MSAPAPTTPPEPGQRVASKEEVRRLLARRYTQAQIGEILGISQPAVSKWKKQIERDGQRAAADRGAEIRATLDTLAELEREAWAAWERSKLPAVVEKSEDGSGPMGPVDKDTTTTTHQVGDATYLNVVLACSTQRRALLGLDAPTKAQEFVMQELKAGLERLRNNLPEPVFLEVARLLAGADS
jgi:transposase-like protein